jgi:hypothetical protein
MSRLFELPPHAMTNSPNTVATDLDARFAQRRRVLQCVALAALLSTTTDAALAQTPSAAPSPPSSKTDAMVTELKKIDV